LLCDARGQRLAAREITGNAGRQRLAFCPLLASLADVDQTRIPHGRTGKNFTARTLGRYC
jgi:hypothetical protein